MLILDLDGTLINSSPTILQGFGMALDQHNITPIRPLSEDLIGPPLKDTLSRLTGISDPLVIEQLAASFRNWYDNEGYRHTVVYGGVHEVLAALAGRTQLYVATNKRLTPTLKIIDHLGWTAHFRAIYALDSAIPAYANKAEMLAALIERESIDIARATYIGDTEGDLKASAANGLRFVAADWGYGGFSALACERLSHPSLLISLK